MTERHKTSWDFDAGEEIVVGRSALQLVGGGHRYEVYLAWDDHLHTVVAVKLLRPGRAGDPEMLERFREEADALTTLQHPVLPRCFDAALEGDRPHLVLEFLEGPRLSTLLRKQKRLALEQAIPLALQLCAALHYLAAEGVVHLDVKSKNVIMGAPPRLVDLSIATSIKRASRMTGPIGTDAYMAPEQCGVEGLGAMGPASDVWGLGVTLYEAIAGRRPFPTPPADAAGTERFPQVSERPRPLPPDIPRVVAHIVMSCLAPEPHARPAAAEVARLLEPLADALPRRPKLGLSRPRI